MNRVIPVIYEEEHFLVVDKPAGILTVPPPRGAGSRDRLTLLDHLAAQGSSGLLAVHRLDLETSGLCVVARGAAARDRLMELFKRRDVEKRYLAVVQGQVRPARGSYDFPIQDLGAHAIVSPRGRPARTEYVVLEQFAPAALLEARPATGRHNQIRIHCAHAGHPLVGERKYAFGRDAVVRHKRAALHAAGLRFPSPWTQRVVVVEAPLPTDFETLLERLRRADAAPGDPPGP